MQWFTGPNWQRMCRPERQREACGDCCGACAGRISLATGQPELREALAEVIRRLCALPLSFDPQWFGLSALACAGQAQSGVGLVHGIAHMLGGPLLAHQPERNWHHARLCATFLEPVMRLNQAGSDKWSQLMAAHRLPEAEIWKLLRALFEPESFRAALPVLRQEWRSVLRDPCSRTNSVLVRPDWLERMENLSLP